MTNEETVVERCLDLEDVLLARKIGLSSEEVVISSCIELLTALAEELKFNETDV